MDDIVLKSLAKWPNVPACFGWLALDRRGNWRMRNEYAQANGLSGDPIRHEALLAFIARNYSVDEMGQWFFQNGPQRVFIELEYTPWVVRLHPALSSQVDSAFSFRTSTDAPYSPTSCWMDEQGNILVEGIVGQVDSENVEAPTFTRQIAILSDSDLELFSQIATVYQDSCGAIGHIDWQGKRLEIQAITRAEIAKHFHFIKSPAALHALKEESPNT